MPLLDQPLGRLLLLALLLALASAGLVLLRRRDGVFRTVATTDVPAPALSVAAAPARPVAPVDPAPLTAAVPATPPAAVVTADEIGRPLGSRATLLQLSSPGCATCPQVHRVLSALAAGNDGVVHVELDAPHHMDLVRRLGVMRTPSVLICGPDGEVRARTSGRLDPVAAAAALAEHAPEPTLEPARG